MDCWPAARRAGLAAGVFAGGTGSEVRSLSTLSKSISASQANKVRFHKGRVAEKGD